MKDKEKIKISPDFKILDALKLMDKLMCKLLVVTEGEKFISVLSIGDIQRAIINNIPLEKTVSKILRNDISIAKNTDSIEKIKSIDDLRTECMPVIDKNNNIIEIYFWDDFYSKSKINSKQINLPVVIMAGGIGSRLKPLTNILPKPLIPIGDKTIIEEIMNRFISIGSNNFFVSIYYKSELIRYYFENRMDTYNINFFKEDQPLGTGGSLYLLRKKLNKTFFVSNCDIIIDQDYRDIYKYHCENSNEITIISALSHYKFPYGVIETGKKGNLISIKEKPEFTFSINSGMYILEPHLIEEVPKNKFFHITQLIEKVMKRKGKIGVFPVSEKSWIDIGDWKKYINEIDVITK